MRVDSVDDLPPHLRAQVEAKLPKKKARRLEAPLQDRVIGLARAHGWRVAHFRRARLANGKVITPVAADGAGFPDLVLVRDRVIFVEIKSDTGRLSGEQKVWRDVLLGAGAEWHEWRPEHADDGTIERCLSATVPASNDTRERA